MFYLIIKFFQFAFPLSLKNVDNNDILFHCSQLLQELETNDADPLHHTLKSKMQLCITDMALTYLLYMKNDKLAADNYKTWNLANPENNLQLITSFLGSNQKGSMWAELVEYYNQEQFTFFNIFMSYHSYLQSVNLSLLSLEQKLEYPLIKLEDNFSLFRMQLFKKKCEYCQKDPTPGSLGLCLICGAVICKGICLKRDKGEKLGNFNYHALEYHCGIGVFGDIETGKSYIIDTPRNVNFINLYEDKYGQSVHSEEKFWEKYKLNREGIKQINKLLCENGIPQEICYLIMRDGNALSVVTI